jgi:hypothetical protein
MPVLIEVVPDFVKILGYGLSGFAFLLMFFAYMLLRQVINKSSQSGMIFKSIWGFMGLSFILTIVIGIFSYMTGDYKKEELASNEVTIKKQETNIGALTDVSNLKGIAVETGSPDKPVDKETVEEAKKESEKVLDDLGGKIKDANATPEQINTFTGLKANHLNLLDSMKRSDLPPDKKRDLQFRILTNTNEINKVTTDVVKKNQLKLDAGTRTRLAQ